MLTPRRDSSDRHATSQPGASAPGPQKTIAVFQQRSSSTLAPGIPGGAPSGPSQTKRVSLPGTSSIPASRTRHPYSRAASRVPIAVQRCRMRSDTSRTASAVELLVITRACGICARMYSRHWAVAWGCEMTTSTSPSGSASWAIRHCSTARTVSPTMRTPLADTSASSATLTEPSSEFSIGTVPRSRLPSATASTVSWIVSIGTSSSASAPGAVSAAA